MPTICFQFEAPQRSIKSGKQNYVKEGLKNLMIYASGKIIPKANPDFKQEFELVKCWCVECDIESGFPERELGLDAQGKVIIKFPYKENCGYWTDNNLLFADFKTVFKTHEISVEEFNNLWSTFK